MKITRYASGYRIALTRLEFEALKRLVTWALNGPDLPADERKALFHGGPNPFDSVEDAGPPSEAQRRALARARAANSKLNRVSRGT